MDANGTRFHLLLGPDDWGRSSDALGRELGLLWEASPLDAHEGVPAWDEANQAVRLHALVFRFPAVPGDAKLAPEQRRGAARDGFGNWFWIAASGREIVVRSAGSGQTSHFWSAADCAACERPVPLAGFTPAAPAAGPAEDAYSGLAVTTDHYLVVGTLAPKGVLVFDLYRGGPPVPVVWPEGAVFAPFDMAPAPGGGVFILDRDNRRYWRLDRHFHVCTGDAPPRVVRPARPDFFQPPGGGRTRPARRSPGGGIPIATAHAVAIEALPDGSVLILETNPAAAFSRIFRYRGAALAGGPASTEAMAELIEPDKKKDFQLLGHDFAFVAPGRLYVAAGDGNQSFAFDITWPGGLSLSPVEQYLPMRLFGGKALVEAGGRAWYDFGDGWIPLVEQRRRRYEQEALLFTQLFDGADPDCVWHRLLFDGCLPAETSVRIWSRAANEKADLAAAEWLPEPTPYQRASGPEVPYAEAGVGGTWELLFQNARGRFLQLKIALQGQGRSTPLLRALRVWYPRFSYLRYVPSLYREDAPSASFLDRFLANFEGMFTSMEDRIAAVEVLFDPDTTPSEALDWLADWFGVLLDPAWDDRKRRLFLRHAMEFFQWRGTLRGLHMALSLALSDAPCDAIFTDPAAVEASGIRIIEEFLARRTPGVVLGDPTSPAPQDDGTRWLPTRPVADLHAAWRAALKLGGSATYPLVSPGPAQDADWRAFSLRVLGFVPSTDAADEPRWQAFLRRRYLTVDALEANHNIVYVSFTGAKLPQTLPDDGALLTDWFQFQAVALAMRNTAHRFTVLLPVAASDTGTSAAQQTRLALAARIIRLEKPAHAVLSKVKFYWAMFRAGYVRLGLDTVLGLGSRAPELLAPLVLGHAYVGESYLEGRATRPVIANQEIRS